MTVAHIAGIPVEETFLSLSPVIATVGGIAGLKLRQLLSSAKPRDANLLQRKR